MMVHVTTSLPEGGQPADIVVNLWDENGNLYWQSYGFGGTEAVVDVFLWQGGTYYVGVSAYPNEFYDPNVPASGWTLGGEGDYRLEISLDKRADPTGPVGGGGQPIAQLSGQGQWRHTTGLPDGGNQIERTSINAWIDSSGVAHGVMTWDDVLNTLPGGGGKGITGYNWVMRVDTLVIDGNSAFVEGVIIVSNHYPADVGGRKGFFVVDNGPGNLDTIDGIPLYSGNFTIRMAVGVGTASGSDFIAGAAPGAGGDSSSMLALALALADIDTAGLDAALLSELATDEALTTPVAPAQRGLECALAHWAPRHSLHVAPSFARRLSDPNYLDRLTGLDALLDRLLTDPEISRSPALSQVAVAS
jgi:hypothetical protein